MDKKLIQLYVMLCFALTDYEEGLPGSIKQLYDVAVALQVKLQDIQKGEQDE